MPRPIAKLEQEQRPLEDRILEFLARDPQNAYTASEIWIGIRDDSSTSLFGLAFAMQSPTRQRELMAPITGALQRLLLAGKIRVLRGDTGEYYALESGV